MTKYDDAYWEHPVHEQLKKTKESLCKLNSDSTDKDIIDSCTMFIDIIDYTSQQLAKVNPHVVRKSRLDAINQTLQKIDQTISVRQHNQLDSFADTFRDNLAWIPFVEVPDGTKVYYEQFSVFQERCSKYLESIKNSETDKTSELSSLREEAAKIKKKWGLVNKQLDQKIEEHDVAIENQLQHFSDSADKTLSLVPQKISEWEGDWNGKIDEWDGSWDQKIKSYEEQLSNLQADFTDQDQKRSDKHEKLAKTLLENINNQYQEACKIVGIAAEKTVTGHYDRIANREWWSSEVLRVFSVACVALFIFVLYWAFKGVVTQSVTWEAALVFRVLLGLPLIGLSVYFASESTRHRRNERRNRRYALEIAAYTPYLNNIQDEKLKSELQIEFARKVFGNIPASEKDGEDESDGSVSISGISLKKLGLFVEKIALRICKRL